MARKEAGGGGRLCSFLKRGEMEWSWSGWGSKREEKKEEEEEEASCVSTFSLRGLPFLIPLYLTKFKTGIGESYLAMKVRLSCTKKYLFGMKKKKNCSQTRSIRSRSIRSGHKNFCAKEKEFHAFLEREMAAQDPAWGVPTGL